jgi:hypothetical protein
MNEPSSVKSLMTLPFEVRLSIWNHLYPQFWIIIGNRHRSCERYSQHAPTTSSTASSRRHNQELIICHECHYYLAPFKVCRQMNEELSRLREGKAIVLETTDIQSAQGCLANIPAHERNRVRKIVVVVVDLPCPMLTLGDDTWRSVFSYLPNIRAVVQRSEREAMDAHVGFPSRDWERQLFLDEAHNRQLQLRESWLGTGDQTLGGTLRATDNVVRSMDLTFTMRNMYTVHVAQAVPNNEPLPYVPYETRKIGRCSTVCLICL